MNHICLIITEVPEITEFPAKASLREGLSDENQVNKHMSSVVDAKHYEEIGFPWIREEFQCSEDEV